MIEPLQKAEALFQQLDLRLLANDELGESASSVAFVEMADGREAVLKWQKAEGCLRSLNYEAEHMVWLKQQGMPVPSLYAAGEFEGLEYLLSEKMSGVPACHCSGWGFELGQRLRALHELPVDACPYIDFRGDHAIERIKDRAKQLADQPQREILDMLTDLPAPPMDDLVVTHGDCCLPNMLIAGDAFTWIDLGYLTVADRCWDFQALMYSLNRNDRMDEWPEFLRGYGKEPNKEKIAWHTQLDAIFDRLEAICTG